MSAPDFTKIALDMIADTSGEPHQNEISDALCAAYRAGQEDMRERAAAEATDYANAVHTFGDIPVDPFEATARAARSLSTAIRAIKVEE